MENALRGQDLRIGNYIANKYANQIIVDLDCLNRILKGKEFYPIELTEARLKRLGFENYQDEWLRIKIKDDSELCFSIMEDNVTDNAGIWKEEDAKGNGGWFYLDCIYVHQLQNIIHALTGQELEFKD